VKALRVGPQKSRSRQGSLVCPPSFRLASISTQEPRVIKVLTKACHSFHPFITNDMRSLVAFVVFTVLSIHTTVKGLFFCCLPLASNEAQRTHRRSASSGRFGSCGRLGKVDSCCGHRKLMNVPILFILLRHLLHDGSGWDSYMALLFDLPSLPIHSFENSHVSLGRMKNYHSLSYVWRYYLSSFFVVRCGLYCTGARKLYLRNHSNSRQFRRGLTDVERIIFEEDVAI